jgi:hypothetical protein
MKIVTLLERGAERTLQVAGSRNFRLPEPDNSDCACTPHRHPFTRNQRLSRAIDLHFLPECAICARVGGGRWRSSTTAAGMEVHENATHP